MFAHGVASGDPMHDRVIIWTRVTPTPASMPGHNSGPATDVKWKVSEDPAFQRTVRTGTVRTDADRDHTVHIDVNGLRAARTYHYRFQAGNQNRPHRSAAPAPLRCPAPRLPCGSASAHPDSLLKVHEDCGLLRGATARPGTDQSSAVGAPNDPN
ncbi:PhoD-like phosphatase N-terminal domain-containing protein [Streptomyces sp. NPDC006012]|uniref:PhoD-like phosphatase N-terminal domain-containing protein n=1 Tax=Streptomyces sp. NPDC006012 TaxID=3364739 RepID=UPI0036B04798